MRQLTPKRLSAWLLTLIMLMGMLPAMASADEADDDPSPPAPQEDYGYVRLVFSEGEQIDLYHGEYITECSPTAAVHDGADEDFLTDGDYLALYYEGRLYHKAALDGVSIDTDAVLPAEDFALVPMGEDPTTLGEEHEDETPPSTEPESTEEDKTTEGEGDPSGSDYGIGDDTQPRGRMRVPVAPTANGNYPSAVFLPNGTTNAGIDLSNGKCLRNNSDTYSTPYTSGMSYVARYDGTTGTLYLNGYDGVANIYAGIGTQNPGVLTIEVESDSKITVNDTGGYSGLTQRRGIDVFEQLVISGNSKLTIDVKCSGKSYGIYAGKGMNITAPLEVNVSVNAPTDDNVMYGLYAYSGDISLSGGDKTIRVSSGTEPAYGISIEKVSNSYCSTIKGKVTVEQTSGNGGAGIISQCGPIVLDEADAEISGAFSTGLFTKSMDGGDITVKNNSRLSINLPNEESHGIYIYPFNTGNYKDGKLTISDSTVNIQTYGSPVFVDGTGSSVSIKDSFVDLTKTADGYPVISTETGSQNSIDLTNSGRVTMTATGNQEYPLFPNLSTITTNTKCTVGRYVDHWTNYAGVYNSSTGTTVLEFVHHESDRRVMLEDISIAGQTDAMLSNEIPDFKLTLQDDFFSDKVQNFIVVDEWFSNRPDGVGFQIRAVDKVATPNTATIRVYGTPTVPCNEPIKVAIPGKYLRSGNPIAASAPNLNARFDIKQTLTESAATITPPVVGQTAGESNAVTSGNPGKYTVTVDHWEKSGNGSMSSTDVFQANQGYYCFLRVTPQPGYAFVRGAKCSVNNGSYTATFSPDNNGLYKVPINPCQSAISLDVSGTVKSYGSASEAVTVTLTKQGETKPTFTDTPTGASGTAPYSQNYSFSAVPAGTYTLKVEKKGHAPWTEKITVGSADVTKDVTIYLIGDVNGDGAISVSDMQRLYAHLNGTKPLTDTSTADVNNDKVISVSDMQRLYAHISGKNPLS